MASLVAYAHPAVPVVVLLASIPVRSLYAYQLHSPPPPPAAASSTPLGRYTNEPDPPPPAKEAADLRGGMDEGLMPLAPTTTYTTGPMSLLVSVYVPVMSAPRPPRAAGAGLVRSRPPWPP